MGGGKHDGLSKSLDKSNTQNVVRELQGHFAVWEGS